jgi:amino acid transporter
VLVRSQLRQLKVITTASARISGTAVVTPTPAVVSAEQKPFPWWIVAVVGGLLFLCLCGAAVYMQLWKKSQADVEVDDITRCQEHQ